MTLRLFLHVLSLEARKQMSYRVDFWLKAVLAFAAQFGVAYFLAFALFAEAGTETIRGYSRPGLLVYLVGVMLVARLVRGSDFGPNTATDIYQGSLTRYLLLPRPYGPIKYAEKLGALAPVALQVLLFAGALAWLGDPGALGITPASAAAAMVSMLVANLLYFLMRMPVEMVAFWHENVWSLQLMLANTARLLGGAMLPLAMFPGWAQRALHWLPFRHLFDAPVRTLLGQVGPAEWAASTAHALAWCLVMAAVTRGVWRRGQLTYTGVGI